MNTPMPIIQVNSLSKTYRLGQGRTYLALRDTFNFPRKHRSDQPFQALSKVSFSVQPGEVVGIIGKNGAGKSTLLKIISRITPPTSGSVVLDGRVGSLLEVGTGFHPELTGRENIFLNGAILGMSHQEVLAKFSAIVDFAEIAKFLDTPVKHYSSGMYMRLAFAVAAHLDPEILIVDEVLSVGDTHFQQKCLGKMGSVARSGRTILFVSHNLDAIRQLCPRTILLERGQIVKDGPTKSVIPYYLKSNLYSTTNQVFKPVIAADGCLKLTTFHIRSDGRSLNWLADLEFFKKPKQFNFVIGITTQTGQRLLALTSLPKLQATNFQQTGSYHLSGSFDSVSLPAGVYQVDVGVRFNDTTVLYVPESGFLKIKTTSQFSGQNGLILTKSDWQVSR